MSFPPEHFENRILNFWITAGSESDLRKRFRSVVPTNYNPRFVYIVVQKRISTRIMMRQDGGKSVENPPPGTILDHTVTRYEFKDFFLVPQAVNQVTEVSVFQLGNFFLLVPTYPLFIF